MGRVSALKIMTPQLLFSKASVTLPKFVHDCVVKQASYALYIFRYLVERQTFSIVLTLNCKLTDGITFVCSSCVGFSLM